MRSLIFPYFVLAIATIGTCLAEGMSGSYVGDRITFKFLEEGNVDISWKVKNIVERGPLGVKYGEDTTKTSRGSYTVLAAKEISDRARKSSATPEVDEAIKRFPEEKGYKRWIAISISGEIRYIFVESGRSIVDVLTNNVYTKAWLSR